MRRALFLFALAVGLGACEPAGGDNIFDIDGQGTIEGIVFVDANATDDIESEDLPAADLSVALVLSGTTDTIARTETDDDGFFTFPLVPVGRYDVVVPDAALDDSMSVVYRDPPGESVGTLGPGDTTAVTVGVADTVTVRIGIAYPTYTVAEARLLPVGRRIFVRGVALAPIDSVADDALFIEGDDRGIAITGLSLSGFTPGDSVLVSGVTGLRDGQPVVIGSDVTASSAGEVFDTIALTAAEARTAGGGVHDARLARIVDLTVTDTTRVGQRFIATAEDPSGSVEISIRSASAPAGLIPGAQLSVTGILVPQPGVVAVWQIRPRSLEDIVVSEP